MRIHISNASARNATVVAVGVKSKLESIPAKDGSPVSFRRYIAAGEKTLHQDLVGKYGENRAPRAHGRWRWMLCRRVVRPAQCMALHSIAFPQRSAVTSC